MCLRLPGILVIVIISYFLSFTDRGPDEEAIRDQSMALLSCITLFLCGDVMTGRGIDQVLPNSVDPRLYESYVKDARDYVRLAERVTGRIDKPVSYSYIWGDALEVWEQMEPAVRIINLETSITSHDIPWPGKGINYRMHPGNVEVLTSAGIDFCSLANNHTMDWGREGLSETMSTLENAGISYAGAGVDLDEARKPVILETGESRVIILASGSVTSGIPGSWAAGAGSLAASSEGQAAGPKGRKDGSGSRATGPGRPGLNVMTALDDETVSLIGKQVNEVKQRGDIVVYSVHWGGNWGYDIPESHRDFARKLIDNAGVDIIHGHSSHHPLGIEVYKDKLIIYGAGDFINDYEGISGREEYRGDLTLMYFPCIDPSNGTLVSMKMVPMRIRNFRLNHASPSDARWLRNMLNREGKKMGTGVISDENRYLSLEWD